MTPFTLGQRVEWRHSSGSRIFHGNLISWIGEDHHYAWVSDNSGLKPRIILTSRLCHPTAAAPKVKVPA